jgi:hypothetical protein
VARLDHPGLTYAAATSPFYRLNSRRHLAALLNWHGSPADLERFIARTDNYRQFPITDRKGKERPVQVPKEALQALHQRVANLLLRITVPAYLQSGRRGFSFITNGRQHTNGMPGLKLDIKSFYPSTTWHHVYRFFAYDMRCVDDVAGALATLCTFNRQLPEPDSGVPRSPHDVRCHQRDCDAPRRRHDAVRRRHLHFDAGRLPRRHSALRQADRAPGTRLGEGAFLPRWSREVDYRNDRKEWGAAGPQSPAPQVRARLRRPSDRTPGKSGATDSRQARDRPAADDLSNRSEPIRPHQSSRRGSPPTRQVAAAGGWRP